MKETTLDNSIESKRRRRRALKKTIEKIMNAVFFLSLIHIYTALRAPITRRCCAQACASTNIRRASSMPKATFQTCLLYTSRWNRRPCSVRKSYDISELGLSEGAVRGLVTVSYTHLDVYKRQDYMKSLFLCVLLQDCPLCFNAYAVTIVFIVPA